jgi:hypothetical protein
MVRRLVASFSLALVGLTTLGASLVPGVASPVAHSARSVSSSQTFTIEPNNQVVFSVAYPVTGFKHPRHSGSARVVSGTASILTRGSSANGRRYVVSVRNTSGANARVRVTATSSRH